MIASSYYMFVSGVLLAISLTGLVLHRQNVIMLLICIELLLLAVNTNFIGFASHYQNTIGEIFVFFILTVAASEAAIGLAIVVLLFRQRGHIDVAKMRQLKG